MTSGSLHRVMVAHTLAQNARDVGSSPALGTLFPIFITPMIIFMKSFFPKHDFWMGAYRVLEKNSSDIDIQGYIIYACIHISDCTSTWYTRVSVLLLSLTDWRLWGWSLQRTACLTV